MHYPQTLKQLAEFFITFATSESEIEAQRIHLTQLDDFDPQLSFKRIDRQNLGYITVSDLLEFLRKYNAHLSDTEIFSFYELFDSDADQRLSYTDFLEAILPTTNLILRLDTAQRHAFGKKTPELHQADIDQYLADFLQTEISFYNRINLIKRSLITSSDWDAHEAFAKIDREKSGFIDRYCLLTFLKQYTKFALSFDELLPLFRIIDTDNDGKLSYTEFQSVFIAKPLQKHRHLNDFSTRIEITKSRIKSQDESPIDGRNTRKPPLASHKPFRVDSREAVHLPEPNQLNSSLSRQSDRTINEHLKQLVDNALKRSQETRARSVQRAINKSFTSYRLDTSKDENSEHRMRRSSPKRSLKFQDDTTTWKNQLNHSNFESRGSVQSDTSFTEDFNIKRIGHAENPRQRSTSPVNFNRSKNFVITPIRCTEDSVREEESTVSFSNEYSKASALDSYKTSKDRSENMPRQMPTAKRVPSTPEKERKKLVENIVNQYINVPKSLLEKTNYIPGEHNTFTEAVSGSKLYRDRSPTQISKAGTPFDASSTSKQQDILIESKYRTPNRSKSLKRELSPSRERDYRNSPLSQEKRSRSPEHEISLSRENEYSSSLESQEKRSKYRSEDFECLARALKEIAELDDQLDSIRKVLAYHSDFTIPAAYQMLFPKLEPNDCTLQRFTDMLTNKGLHLDSQHISLIFGQFDRDKDGVLSMNDFEQLIKSKDIDAVEVMEGRRSEYIHKSDTRNLVNQFFKMATVFEISIEDIRQKLKQRPGFGLESAIRAVDTYRLGYITVEELKELAESHGVNLTQKDLRILMKRYDSNNEGKISLSKLADELTPKGF